METITFNHSAPTLAEAMGLKMEDMERIMLSCLDTLRQTKMKSSLAEHLAKEASYKELIFFSTNFFDLIVREAEQQAALSNPLFSMLQGLQQLKDLKDILEKEREKRDNKMPPDIRD